jgi:hypothetical protein
VSPYLIINANNNAVFKFNNWTPLAYGSISSDLESSISCVGATFGAKQCYAHTGVASA